MRGTIECPICSDEEDISTEELVQALVAYNTPRPKPLTKTAHVAALVVIILLGWFIMAATDVHGAHRGGEVTFMLTGGYR